MLAARPNDRLESGIAVQLQERGVAVKKQRVGRMHAVGQSFEQVQSTCVIAEQCRNFL